LYHPNVQANDDNRIWTRERRLMGNLIPFLLWLPPSAYGLYRVLVDSIYIGEGLVWMGIGLALGWLGVNGSGVLVNAHMKRDLKKALDFRREKLPPEHWFVGFASPKFFGVLDAHEDVGFLALDSGEVRFISEVRNIHIARDEILDVHLLPNVHSILGLGCWVCIEGKNQNVPIRLQVEPREFGFMVSNLWFAFLLRKRLRSSLRKRPGSVPK
jgi:hypothetical protein